jgi:hypothetical protein
MQTLLSRIDLKTGIYRTQMQTALRNDTSADLSDNVVSNYISNFENSVTRLKQRVDSRQSTGSDVTDLLSSATYIDQFMTRNRLTPQAQAQWRNLRADLNLLITDYRLSWNWNQTLPGDNNRANVGSDVGRSGLGIRNFDSRITGTYRLNTGLSEDPATVINRSMGSSSNMNDARGGLERRLRSPDMIAIEMNNKTVTMASTILPQVTFQADGVARTETNARGRTVTTTATVDADGLIINYLGERTSDFYLTFLPMPVGRLKVTRRIYPDNTSQGITVSSVYDKVENMARWSSVTPLPNNANTGDTGVSGVIQDSFIVPAGTRLNA